MLQIAITLFGLTGAALLVAGIVYVFCCLWIDARTFGRRLALLFVIVCILSLSALVN